MKVTLKHITPDAENLIGDCAAECYDGKRDRQSNIRRARSCKTKGHLATRRFAYAIFHISGISRICSHQFVRSKHLDFLQQSQRYVNQKDCKFVRPPSFDSLPRHLQARWMSHELEAKALYNELICAGMKKEDARYILLESTETSLAVVGNFQAWQDFINLRITQEAQHEIRKVAAEIDRALYDAEKENQNAQANDQD